MDRRSAAAKTTPVATALKVSGVSLDSLAQATHIPSSVLSDRLANEADFTLVELRRVGGFLRINPVDLMVRAA